MKTKRRVALTLWLGLAIIAATEILLAVDVHQRGVTILPAGPGEIVAAPDGAMNHLARWAAIHMTPVCWVGFLLVMDGLLALVARPGSPARSRPRRFALCFVSGVGVWLFFDWVNFFFIHAWDYHGLESMTRVNTYVAKFVAFGAISPAMFMTAELFQQLGLRRLRGPRIPFGRPWQIALFIAGVPALIYPFWVGEPIGSTTLWLSLFLLCDPLNRWLGAPSLIGDWQAGRFGRSASLALGGLTCGFFWALHSPPLQAADPRLGR